jgi:predicted ATPase
MIPWFSGRVMKPAAKLPGYGETCSMTGNSADKQLSRIVLNGFKSIAACDLELSDLNVLIGANGAGKSNFIGFFRMVQQLFEENLQVFVSREGGPDALLHFGRKTTEQLEFQLYFGNNGYSILNWKSLQH